MQLFEEKNDRAENVTDISALKDSARRLGLGMVVLVINSAAAPFLFSLIVLVILGIAPTDDNSYYAMLFILNELSAYALPVIILTAVFGRECAEFVPHTRYALKPCESLVLFLAGVSAGSLGTLVTQQINSVIDSLFGTGEIPPAFGGMEPENLFQFAVFSVCICIVAPICEEYIFRRLLLQPLRVFGDLTAALLSGLIFGLYHANFDQFAYAALLGFFQAVIAIRRNSIIPAIVLHALNNFIVVFSTYSPTETAFTAAVSTASALVFPAGLIALGVSGGMGLLKFEKNASAPRLREGMAIIVKNPAFIIGAAAMLAAFFV